MVVGFRATTQLRDGLQIKHCILYLVIRHEREGMTAEGKQSSTTGQVGAQPKTRLGKNGVTLVQSPALAPIVNEVGSTTNVSEHRKGRPAAGVRK